MEVFIDYNSQNWDFQLRVFPSGSQTPGVLVVAFSFREFLMNINPLLFTFIFLPLVWNTQIFMDLYFIRITLLLPWKSVSIFSHSGNCVFIVSCFQKDKLPYIYFTWMPKVDLAQDAANLYFKTTLQLFIVADVILISACEISFQ